MADGGIGEAALLDAALEGAGTGAAIGGGVSLCFYRSDGFWRFKPAAPVAQPRPRQCTHAPSLEKRGLGPLHSRGGGWPNHRGKQTIGKTGPLHLPQSLFPPHSPPPGFLDGLKGSSSRVGVRARRPDPHEQ